MKNITITKENLQKAFDEGCDDTKKVLKNLCPDEFKEGFDENKIYAFAFEGRISIINALPQKDWGLIDLCGKGCQWYSSKEEIPQKVYDHYKEANDFKVFDTPKDFFEWALKQMS